MYRATVHKGADPFTSSDALDRKLCENAEVLERAQVRSGSEIDLSTYISWSCRWRSVNR